MAIPGPGVAISMNTIATEFGGTVPHSLSEYYRGGGLVPNVAQNAAIPTSGAIPMGSFYGATNRVAVPITVSSNSYNYDVYTNRSPAYVAGISDIIVTVNPGVTVGSTSTGTYAMLVPSAFNPTDTVTIINNGVIQGMGGGGGGGGTWPPNGTFGGSGGVGGGGGNAVYVNRPTVITNNGTLAGGGGGGGGGGASVGPIFKGSFGASGGGGGGGGAGFNGGGAGAGGSRSGPSGGLPGSPGGVGTSPAGGGGGAGGVSGTVIGGPGGAGGGQGAGGAPGNIGPSPTAPGSRAPGGGGGGAGNYIVGNPFVTYPATGTRKGGVA